MNAYAKLAIGAVAVLIIAVVGITLLPNSEGGVGGGATATPTPTASFASPTTGAAPTQPVIVTAALSNGPQVGQESYTEVDGRVERRGTIRALPFTASDPRLEGDFTQSIPQDAYPGASGPETFVFATQTIRIENADGAWQGSVSNFSDADELSGTTVILVGEGAYQGLYAALDVTGATDSRGIKGVIFPAPPPPVPAAP